MNDRKKVLLLINSLGRGGAERAMAIFSDQFSEEFNQKFVLLEDRVDFDFSGEIEILSLPQSSKWSFFGLEKLVRFWFISKQILSIKREFNPSFVISSLPYLNLVNSIFVSKNISVVQNLASADKGKNFKSYLFYKIIGNFSHSIVAVSSGVKKDLVENFGVDEEKIKVIYNPVDIDKVQDMAKKEIDHPKFLEWSQDDDITIYLNIGSLTKQKGHSHLLKSFKFALSNNGLNNSRLVIIGEGSRKDELQELAQDLDMSDRVLFLGFRNNPHKFLYKSDVFALSSLWEGLPLVLLEALACNISLISTDCTEGVREIFGIKSGSKLKDIRKTDIGILTPEFKDDEKNPNITDRHKMFAKALLSVRQNKKDYSDEPEKRAEMFGVDKYQERWKKLLKKRDFIS